MPAPMGVLNLDKPAGPTSHDVVQRVRQVVGIRRVGHAGTLDPLATGVLLVFVGRATRLVEHAVALPKTYVAAVRLGQETDTYDAEGQVVADKPVTISQDDIVEALQAFRGQIHQRPPMFSAVKSAGQPLYKMARQGLAVPREPRVVTVYELQLLEVALPSVSLSVRCSAGTYIRSLAHDLGQKLGCGGHITSLRRTEIGHFHVDEAISLGALGPESLGSAMLPADVAVRHLPAVTVSEAESRDLCHGRRIPMTVDSEEGSLARAYKEGGAFLGLVAAQDGQWRPRKMLVAAG